MSERGAAGLEKTGVASRPPWLSAVMRLPQLLILVLMVLVLSLATSKFATPGNILNILKQVSVMATISCGLTLVVISGALDLSVGSMFSLLGVVAVSLQTRSVTAAILGTILLAIVLGLFNGFVVSAFDVNSIIVTLGSLSIFSGIGLLYSNGGLMLAKPNTPYSLITKGEFAGVPINVFIFIVIAIIYQFVLRKTSFGRKLVYVGTNQNAARIAGIRVGMVRGLAFVISGFSVAIASIILSARLLSASPTSGVGFEFDAVTAVVIGGVSLQGGKGSILNTIVGVLLLAVIINALTLYNVPFAFQNIVKGLLIVVAVAFDTRMRLIREK
jgi:ribose/xylose/arabinose/galactoside ABC-type transport system permease subunit